MILYKDDLTILEVEKNDNLCGNYEFVQVDLCRGKLGILRLVGFYRPPGKLHEDFVNDFQEILSSYSKSRCNGIVFMGDLNMPNIDWVIMDGYRNLPEFAFIDLIQEFNLAQCNENPSRLTNENILDVVITDREEQILSIDASICAVDTDHLQLDVLLVGQSVINKEINKGRQVYNWKKADIPNFLKTLSISELNEKVEQLIQESQSIDTVWQTWKSILFECLDKHVPKVHIKNLNTPQWVDAELVKLSRKKKTIWRHMKKIKTESTIRKYKAICKQVKELTLDKYNKYVDELASRIKDNPKRFWGLLKNKTNANRIPNQVNYETNVATSPIDKANLFNVFFERSFTVDDLSECSAVLAINDKIPFDLQVSPVDVRLQLEKLKPEKAIGVDDIPNLALKIGAKLLTRSLCNLFNYSIISGNIPNEWKMARVVPVYKKGDKSDVSNYRPISLLPVVSKILERCILNKLQPKLQHNLYYLQHGFTSGKSTITQLIDVYDKVNQILDRHSQCDMVFLDFTKAFDSVCHRLLLLKVQALGIRDHMLNWLRCYLSNRYQHVVVEGHKSEIAVIKSGVPQGSILGPFLFLLYINDLYKCVKLPCEVALFADDAKIYCEIKDECDCLYMTNQLEKVYDWSTRWKMKFNVRKCFILSISNRNRILTFEYHFGNGILQRVDEFVDLGVTITNHLTWSPHISNIVAKARRNLGYIKRILGPKAPLQAKRMLYISLVRSVLQYCSQLWSPYLRKDTVRIESVQRQATRFMVNYIDLTYKDRLLQCNLLPLTYVREIHDLILFYDLTNRRLNVNIDRYFLSNIEQRRGRSANVDVGVKKRLFHTEQSNSCYGNRSISLWQNLEPNVRQIPPPVKKECKPLAFKRALYKEYYKRLLEKFDPANVCSWVTVCRCATCRLH
jgi:hypothetical protein